MFNKILIAGLCLAVSWVQGVQIRMYQNGPSSEALAAVAGLDHKADKTYVDGKVKTDVPADAKFTETTINNKTGAIEKADIVALGIPAQDTIVDITGKADKALPYTPLTGADVTVSPSMSYVWETTAGTNLLTASGFTAGVDASCSMIITMFEGDTVAASGLSFADELEVGVNHCFIRQMPTGGVQLFVSYVGDVYGDIFVDGAAPEGGDGTSWRTAYNQIQPAIEGVTNGNLILVKPGTYTPIDSLDKSITIESTGGAEVTTIDGNNTARCAKLTNATLNGFKLTKGFAGEYGENPENLAGGGSVGGTLNNCILTGNTANEYGGGSAYGTLNNCILTGNTSEYGYGGGSHYSTLNNCTLTGNTAGQGGGSNDSILNNCTLSGNTSKANGGGSYGGTLNNCTLTGNTANEYGGGSEDSTLNNCIVWGNTIGEWGQPGTDNYYNSTLNYCNSDPSPAGTGNISQDPKFIDVDNLRLQASSPCINAGSNDLAVGNKDLDGNPRIFGGMVDMGAYEYQGE